MQKNISNTFNTNSKKILFFISFIFVFIESNVNYEGIFFAQNLLNYYKFNNSYNAFFETIKNAEFTMQIFFPYLLLKLGLNFYITNFIINTIIINISIFSIYFLSQIFTKKKIVSFSIPIILIFFELINSRWYGIKYPISFFYFGQLGMYLFILSASLFVLNKEILSYHFLIIGFFCHAAWGLLTAVFILLYFFLKKDKIKIPSFRNLIVFLIFLLITIFSLTDLKKNNLDYKKTTSTLTNFYGKFQETGSEELNKFKTTHKVKLLINQDPFKTSFNLLRFYSFDLIFIIIFLLVLKKEQSTEKKFFWVCSIIWASIHIYNIFDVLIIEFTSSFSVFLGGVIDRIIPTRFLNFINVLVTIYCLNILLTNNNIAVIYFKFFFITISIILLIFFKDVPINIGYFKNVNLNILSIFFLLIYCLALFPAAMSENFDKYKNLNQKFYIFLFVFFSLNVVLMAYESFKDHRENKNLFTNNINIKKTMLYGGNVYGKINANYYLNIPLLVMVNPQFPFYNRKIYDDIFCNRLKKTFEDQHSYFDYMNNNCFAKKTNLEWLNFKKLLDIEYVLVPNHVKLDLPILGKTEKFLLYVIKKN